MPATKIAAKKVAKKAVAKKAARKVVRVTPTPVNSTYVEPLFDYSARMAEHCPEMPFSEIPGPGRTLTQLVQEMNDPKARYSTSKLKGIPLSEFAQGTPLPEVTPYGEFMRANNTTYTRVRENKMIATKATWESDTATKFASKEVTALYEHEINWWLRRKDTPTKHFLKLLSSGSNSPALTNWARLLRVFSQGLSGVLDGMAGTGDEAPGLLIANDTLGLSFAVDPMAGENREKALILHFFPYVTYESQLAGRCTIVHHLEAYLVLTCLRILRGQFKEGSAEAALYNKYADLFVLRGLRVVPQVGNAGAPAWDEAFTKLRGVPQNKINRPLAAVLSGAESSLRLSSLDPIDPSAHWEIAHAVLRYWLSPSSTTVSPVTLSSWVNHDADLGAVSVAKEILFEGGLQKIKDSFMGAHAPAENSPGLVIRAFPGVANQKQYYV